MPERDERLYLAEILGAIDRALEYTAGGRATLFADPKTQDAVIRNIEIMGEAVKALSQATRLRHLRSRGARSLEPVLEHPGSVRDLERM